MLNCEECSRSFKPGDRENGPKIVTIGGGTGLSALLRGLKEYTDNITAIVTVADDGGSSGQLRRDLGILPPGDFRSCIAALADDEALITQLLQYRFREDVGLQGHSFGNLLITAMAEVTGSFEKALVEVSNVLAVRGHVFPSSLQDVTLCADLADPAGKGTRKVRGESSIPKARCPIERVYLEPVGVRGYPPSVRAILDAELVVAGPGSLYTSIIPNLLVEEIAQAVRATFAPRLYVCNVATQPGETEGYSLADHVTALEQHVGYDLFPNVLANNDTSNPLPDKPGLEYVYPTPLEGVEGVAGGHYNLVLADVADAGAPWRHDSKKLAAEVMNWLSLLHTQERSPVDV